MNMERYGWDAFFENNFKSYSDQGFFPARVCVEHKHLYSIYTNFGELLGEVSGKLRFNALNDQDFPAVGDWVAVDARPKEGKATIHGILSRKTKFSRKVAGGETREQVIATNFDYVFIVNSLNRDFNIRRIERYLIMAWESGATPVVILSKSDLCDDILEKVREVEAVAIGVPIHVISSLQGKGIEELNQYFGEGRTVAVLGSSGVGKSTLINSLAGEQILEVQAIREEDDKGRHTTTHRQLVLLPSGGMIIDTPGMREFQLWEGAEGFHETFEDIEKIALSCRFKDCRHRSEPGCAINAVISNGTLSIERMESYIKLQKEMRYLEIKQSQLGMIEQKKMKKRGKQGQLAVIKQKTL